MIPQPAVTGPTAKLPIDIRRFPWIRRLAADYAYAYANLADFFAGDPADPGAWRDAIAGAQRHDRNRTGIAEVVRAQQEKRGAPPEAIAAAAQLRDPNTVALVTGQQAGLFGGPLFTLLKAITTIRLAERVRIDHQVSAVAVFWIDSEDHDWDEIKVCGVLDAELELFRVAVGNPPGAYDGPVGHVHFDGSVNGALEDLEARLPQTEFTIGLLDSLRKAYRHGARASEAFGQWLETVLGPRGLIVYDAADAAAKPLVADIFAREVEHAGETSRLAAEAGLALEARGYHAQVGAQEGQVAIFHLDGRRAPIRQQDGRFQVGDRVHSKAALLEQIKRSPGEFSPNVLLRPLVQDALFPTACYVAGPNELAYLAQLRPVYEAFEIPMPLVYQRATATLLDSNATRFLTRYNVALESLQPQDEAVLNALLASQLPPGVEATLEDAARVIHERMDALAAAMPQIDPTLEGAARSTLGRMQDDLKKLHGKIIQAIKRRDETLRRQFRHVQALAFPGGHPQEREIGSVYFLNKYGLGLIDRLADELPLDMGIHWVITI